MIALCRAVNIPARFTTGLDFGADPALGPPDFHAYVEAYLGGRWYIFDPSATAIPLGFVRIAVANMANAIKRISVARGHDVTRYTLQCFGGAGGQHACLVADALGMAQVFVHPLAGVLSAYGMGLADQNVMREQAVERRLEAAAVPAIGAALDTLAEAAMRAEIAQLGFPSPPSAGRQKSQRAPSMKGSPSFSRTANGCGPSRTASRSSGSASTPAA